MKKIAFWSYYENFAINNSIFNESCTWNNKLFYKYKVLKDILYDNNIAISPLNDVELSNINAVIFYDVPNNINYLLDSINRYQKIRKILIIEECQALRPKNWLAEIHNKFDIVYTWSENLISNNEKYKKIYLTNLNKKNYKNNSIEFKNNSIILLNSNKKLSKANELYSLRRSIIDYAHNYKITNFKLYGNDWNRLTFNMDKWYSFLNSRKFNSMLNFSKYKHISNGTVVDKDKVMSEFDFSICFENVKDIPDYFTEKMTDTMIAGVIPIYYGCPNINKYFPENTYIDYRNFVGISDLFEYITKMPAQFIIEYKNNIKNFLDSDASNVFTGDYFARTIADDILSIKD